MGYLSGHQTQTAANYKRQLHRVLHPMGVGAAESKPSLIPTGTYDERYPWHIMERYAASGNGK